MSVYLDNAASTALVPQALAAMSDAWSRPGNPMSLHDAGRRARRLLEESRETIARCVGARPSEVIFTAGGTEADNLAVKGIYRARNAQDQRRRRLVISAVEHHAVLDPAQWLADNEGAELVVLPVDAHGRVDPADLRAELAAHADEVAMISVMWANNEVGCLQPIDELSALGREFGVPLHSDAVAAVGHVPVDFAALGVDALTLTGHKLGGPFGVGALVVRRELAVTPLLHGGGQERDIRSGTIDTPAIAGFAEAVELSVKLQPEHAAQVGALRDQLVRRIQAEIPDAIFNGDPVDRLPGNAHLKFPGCQGDSLLMLLDARGIECSTGSACSAGVPQPSHVLLAMGCSDEYARSSLRFSLGRTTTQSDVDALVAAIGPVVERARTSGNRKGTG